MDDDDSNRNDRQIVVRESTLRVEIARLEKEEAALSERLLQVRADLMVKNSLLAYFPTAPERPGSPDTPSIREMALEVLGTDGRAMGVREMIDAMEDRFGAHVARTSLSPILKKMEGRGLVEHVGTTWKGKGPSAATDGPTGDDRSSDLSSQPSEGEKGDIEMS